MRRDPVSVLPSHISIVGLHHFSNRTAKGGPKCKGVHVAVKVHCREQIYLFIIYLFIDSYNVQGREQ